MRESQEQPRQPFSPHVNALLHNARPFRRFNRIPSCVCDKTTETQKKSARLLKQWLLACFETASDENALVCTLRVRSTVLREQHRTKHAHTHERDSVSHTRTNERTNETVSHTHLTVELELLRTERRTEGRSYVAAHIYTSGRGRGWWRKHYIFISKITASVSPAV